MKEHHNWYENLDEHGLRETLKQHIGLLEENQKDHDRLSDAYDELKVKHNEVLAEKEVMRRCIMELVTTMSNDDLVEYVVVLNNRILNKG